MARAVLKHAEKNIYKEDILKALRKAGIKEEETIFVHSDLSRLGKLGDIKNLNDFLDSFIDVFLEVVGGKGTVIVPTFSYSFTKKENFNVNLTKSTLGILTERLRNRDKAIRSVHPLFSVAAVGKDARFFTKNLSLNSFGKNSVFERMWQRNTAIVLFGLSEFLFTFIHYVEENFGVPYRYYKRFKGQIINKNKKYDANYRYYVRDLEINPITDLSRLYREMKRKKLLKESKLGNGKIIVIHCRDVFTVAKKMLRKNIYSLIKKPVKRGKTINKLHFNKLPFHIGMQDSSSVLNFPHFLPFTLSFNKALALISQKTSSEVDLWNKRAYENGSSLSTPLGEGSFGKAWADDVINALSSSLKPKKIKGKSFLEIGCNKGYLLHLLKLKGAGRCLGVEPDPISKIGAEEYNIEIINDFFNPKKINGKFDVIFTHGILEHIKNPVKFLQGLKSCIKPNGIIFTAVPNCEVGLSIGDLSLLNHEHYNYFTIRSLSYIYKKLGLTSVQHKKANYGWMFYIWGKVKLKKTMIKNPHKKNILKEKKLFDNYVLLCNRIIQRMQKIIDEQQEQHKSIGIYGAYPYFLMFNWKRQPRFFDGDVAKYGKYLLGSKRPVENPDSLKKRPVDLIWIAPINHDSAIKNFLEKRLKLPKEKIVSLKEMYKSEKQTVKNLL